jgi:hypothetical protein
MLLETPLGLPGDTQPEAVTLNGEPIALSIPTRSGRAPSP